MKDYEQALIEVEKLRNEKAGLHQIIDQKDAQIRALNALESINKMRIDSLLEAVKERTTANTLDDKRIVLYEQSLTDYKEQTKRLIAERDSARRAQKVWGVVGLVLGIAATYNRK